METIRDQKFAGRSFVIDETVFINCQLTDCDLYYEGGDFDWANTSFNACRFHWRGAAKRTADLLRLIGALKEQPQAEGQIPPTTTAAGKPN
jgi:hypothetical protein